VDGRASLPDGSAVPIDQQTLLAPLEGALRAMAWAVALLATALALASLT
jgi:hypothetical protein